MAKKKDEVEEVVEAEPEAEVEVVRPHRRKGQ